jgi:hypothetical protein
MAQAVPSGVATDYHREKNAGPHGGGSYGVQNKLECFLFCDEYCPNCLCTLSNSKNIFKSKLLDKVLAME